MEETSALEALVAGAHVGLREGGRQPVFACEQAAAQRLVGEYAEAQAGAGLLRAVLMLTPQEAVAGLQAHDRRDGGDEIEGLGVVVAHTEVTQLALLPQAGEGAEGLLQRGAELTGPVDLQEVDALRAQAAQRRLQVGAYILGGEHALGVVADELHAHLGGDGDLAHPRPEGGDEHLLGVAAAVDGGGVEPVDAEVERLVDRGGAAGVAHVVAPVITADRPTAEADDGEVELGPGEAAVPHRGDRVWGLMEPPCRGWLCICGWRSSA